MDYVTVVCWTFGIGLLIAVPFVWHITSTTKGFTAQQQKQHAASAEFSALWLADPSTPAKVRLNETIKRNRAKVPSRPPLQVARRPAA